MTMLKTARAVHPSYAVRLRYQRQMQKMIRRMAVSVEYWVKAWREAEPPQMAQDALPTTEMLREFRKLATRWRKHFDEMAPTVAEIFLKNQFKGTDVAFKEALKAAGWAVEFKLTRAMRDAFEAKLAENVGLIRSIPEQYLAEVEGIVMRNYASGRDVASMAREIRGRYKVASDRAVLIARDQSNKANAVVQRARRKELGITEAIWMHSHAGKEPRPTHEAFNRKRFDVEKGMWDKDANGKGKGAWVFPGELINCFPGDSKVQFADGVLKAYRRFYRGELAEIITNTGKSVRATMNHPVLTPDGWIALGLLNEGDDILCVPYDRLGSEPLLSPFSPVVEKNVDGAIPTFAEVFSSISESGGIGYSEVSHAGQFHGDGWSDGDVDVVLSARPLRFGVHPAIKNKRKQFVLSMSNYAAL
ncbi:MAG: hypothetical protein KGL39_49210, partial [Patescibacteria group bacterium]|nr:hypothetical protein [Patescibacteria group bacterium]